jgi:hypothetical protein
MPKATRGGGFAGLLASLNMLNTADAGFDYIGYAENQRISVMKSVAVKECFRRLGNGVPCSANDASATQ